MSRFRAIGTRSIVPLVVLGLIAVSAYAVTPAERLALIALYNSTGGDSWTNSNGWKTPPLDADGFALSGTENTWFGLTVDPGTQRVTGISLTGNNLVGTIPAEIGDLTDLQNLYLENGQLTGPIPAEIGNLTRLYHLSLSNNQLSGSIPAALGSLSNLGYLYLNINQLSGSIPLELCSLPNLRQLFLYSNQLSGSIPPELGNMTSLTWIVLRYNQLSGEIPAELGNLTDLQVLRLGDNQLSGEIPAELGNLVKLQSLRLSHNHLTGEIPDSLGNLTQLWELFIGSNQLTGGIPTSLANLTALTTTDIGYNALHTSDGELITFLNAKDPDWAATQTIAPTNVTATSLDNAIILVSWLPVTYTANAGYYRVLISEAAGGPYTLAGQTENKATSSVQVTGLTPGRRYYFVVQTHTNAHANNPNAVESDYSTEASAVAWLQLNVQITGTITLGGAPLAGVVMNGLTGNPVSDGSGVYTGTQAAGWSGTVVPALAGYAFNPVSRTYTTVTADQTAQGYVATAVVPAITVTSPNGGETWAVGSAHAITWTQTNLTGSVTIDLYKGGVYQKTLGTANATAGTLAWTLSSSETAGNDYMVCLWQDGGVLDDSDANFEIVRSLVRVDFNKDGQEDILWRYYGEGGYIRAWFLGDTDQAALPLSLADARMRVAAKTGADRSKTIISDPRYIGKISGKMKDLSSADAQEVADGMKSRNAASVSDPRKAGGVRTQLTAAAVTDPRHVNLLSARASSPGSSVELAATPAWLGGADVMPVDDLSWMIVGTGDFNNDGNVDILWRNSSTGSNVVWFMNGTEWSASAELLPVADQSWQIVGTGDFNRDGEIDILWRNSSDGSNVVWYLDGATWTGSAVLLGVSDQNWQIVGTGDFNRDGNVDILWRYNGAGGYNVVWYMEDATWIGSAELIPVGDTAWQIMGTGDYNRDGNVDILWRYNGAGGYNVIWYLNGVIWSESAELLSVSDLTWRIVSR